LHLFEKITFPTEFSLKQKLQTAKHSRPGRAVVSVLHGYLRQRRTTGCCSTTAKGKGKGSHRQHNNYNSLTALRP